MLTPVESALDRVLQAYSLMFNDVNSNEVRPKVEKYLNTLASAGEKDPDRLAVCGLAYLRKDEPAHSGYSGM
jgi:hypothetical protein